MLRPASDCPLPIAEERSLDRRRLLVVAGAAAVAALAAEWLARRPAPPRAAPRLRVAGARALAPGSALAVGDGTGGEVVVARLRDASLVAFDRRCPHLGCPVVYAAERDRFECPCHHAAFDARTGGVLFGPPPHGLTRVEVVA